MKTLLFTSISIILILIMGLTTQKEDYHEYDKMVEESYELTDSALIYLKELHTHNDSLLDKYFPKEVSQIK